MGVCRFVESLFSLASGAHVRVGYKVKGLEFVKAQEEGKLRCSTLLHGEPKTVRIGTRFDVFTDLFRCELAPAVAVQEFRNAMLYCDAPRHLEIRTQVLCSCRSLRLRYQCVAKEFAHWDEVLTCGRCCCCACVAGSRGHRC